jgi:peptidoglycan hydrolase CwlO-like protein
MDTEEFRTLLRQELAPIQVRLDGLEAKTDSLQAKTDSLQAKIDSLQAKTDSLQVKIDSLQAKTDSLPLINRALTVLQQEIRSLRAAFNDFARTNVTAGQAEALHADVNRVQLENAELAARLATAERLLREIKEKGS